MLGLRSMNNLFDINEKLTSVEGELFRMTSFAYKPNCNDTGTLNLVLAGVMQDLTSQALISCQHKWAAHFEAVFAKLPQVFTAVVGTTALLGWHQNQH